MKSLYFQTVGIECKVYENQQLEYRLFILQKCFNAPKVFQTAIFFVYALLCV